MSHIWMSHGMHFNESCQTWMSHVTQMCYLSCSVRESRSMHITRQDPTCHTYVLISWNMLSGNHKATMILRMPYLHRSFSSKESYNWCFVCGKRLAASGILCIFTNLHLTCVICQWRDSFKRMTRPQDERWGAGVEYHLQEISWALRFVVNGT